MKKIIWISFICIIFQVNIFAFPTISWSGVQDIDIGAESSTGRGTVHFDFNGDSANEYIIEYGPDGLLMLPQNGNEMIMFDEIPFSPLVFLVCKRLAAGDLIDAAPGDPLLWHSENDLLVQSLGGVSGGISGYWKGADHEYMGVRFSADDGIHYGWIEMSVSDTYELATIHSWAYNTVPGEGLVAGVVPEPSTIALFLVGVITFGIKRFR